MEKPPLGLLRRYIPTLNHIAPPMDGNKALEGQDRDSAIFERILHGSSAILNAVGINQDGLGLNQRQFRCLTACFSARVYFRYLRDNNPKVEDAAGTMISRNPRVALIEERMRGIEANQQDLVTGRGMIKGELDIVHKAEEIIKDELSKNPHHIRNAFVYALCGLLDERTDFKKDLEWLMYTIDKTKARERMKAYLDRFDKSPLQRVILSFRAPFRK